MAKGNYRNAPCWCGSGKKYKKCHLNREHEKSLPLEALENVLHEAWKHKNCLHPSAAPGVCDAIVAAHSIQRSRVLDKIVDSKKRVLTFFPLRADLEGRVKVHRVGWKEASTFTGFCAKHDGSTFSPIENVRFSGSEQQCFLLGYRALCHEIYQKTGALKSSPEVRRLIDRGLAPSDQREVQHLFATLAEGQEKGLSNSQNLKGMMDGQLLSENYSGWSRTVIEFKGELCISSTGAINPNRDLEGNRLQDLQEDLTLETLLFGMAATDDGGAAVFIWPDKEVAPRTFVESLLKNGGDRLPSFLVQFMFAFIENTFFSVRWWDSLSEIQRSHLAALAEIANPYYDTFPFMSSKMVPWKVTNILLQ
jgi:hypothetical protein